MQKLIESGKKKMCEEVSHQCSSDTIIKVADEISNILRFREKKKQERNSVFIDCEVISYKRRLQGDIYTISTKYLA